MNDNSFKIMKNDTSKKVDEGIQYNGQNENSVLHNEIKTKKFEINVLENNKIKNKKFEINILEKNDSKNAILYSKEKIGNVNGKSLFSNVEIKKYINDKDKINIRKGNDYLPQKIKNRNINYFYNRNNEPLTRNNKFNNELLLNDNKKLKEESTNTYINNMESDNQKGDSFNSKKINKNSKGDILMDKTPDIRRINNNNILYNNTNVFNANKINQIKRKVNNIYNLSIDNNINFNQEANNNNNIKNYFELYSFHLLQSLIQNRSNLFKLKNNSLFSKNKLKNPRSINLSLFLNNANINTNDKLSLRELYRKLNNDKLSLNIIKINSTKKNKMDKIRKKTFENKNKNFKNIFEKKTNLKLMNVQYILDASYKKERNRNINRNNFFQKTLFEKRVNYINNHIFKSENKSEYQSRKYIKTSTNFHPNILTKQSNAVKEDILDRGLSNSPPYIKTLPKRHLTKIKNNKNIFSDLKIKI